ncbi:hypothetical protein CBR_g776 [Chara braunii]|uniref:aconitate hydratase n=1 Tax=Chara braunii TaxID=69332 RepID=A0A388KC62_CHABU|nr:hypothetical protein CBR_g776 [Chara braunii]|eukprot:GBG67648.1 hypothetical protein CBR_g776 [Chara braunii]
MDDILVYSSSYEGHVQHIEWTLHALRDAGFKVALEKCQFFLTTISFLGHVVTDQGLRPEPQKVAAVRDAPVPTTITQVRAFLGLASYYRRLIKGFVAIEGPLTNLLKRDQPPIWTPECDQAFSKLKAALISVPVLIRPDPEKPFVLITDWQPEAISAILAQVGPGGLECVVEYASKSVSACKHNYAAPTGECYAALWGISHFRAYLYGRKFTLVTDHEPLLALKKSKDYSGMIGRWATVLQSMDFDIRHQKHERHGNADGLTRLHRTEKVPKSEEVIPWNEPKDENGLRRRVDSGGRERRESWSAALSLLPPCCGCCCCGRVHSPPAAGGWRGARMQPPLLQAVVSMTASGAGKWAGGRVLGGLAKGGGGESVRGASRLLLIRVAGPCARARAPCQPLPRHVCHHPTSSSSSGVLPPAARQQQQQQRRAVHSLPRNHHLLPASRFLRGVPAPAPAPADAAPSLLSSSSHYSHLSVFRSSSAGVPGSALLSCKGGLSLCAGSGSSSSGSWAPRVLGGNSAGTDVSPQDCAANRPLHAGCIKSPPLSSAPLGGRNSLAAAAFSTFAASSLFSRKISSSAVARVARLEPSSQATSTSCRQVHTMATENPFKQLLRDLPDGSGGIYGKYYSLKALNDPRIDKLPYSIKILLESAIRNCDNFQVTQKDVESIIDWERTAPQQVEIPFKPARVILQDFTGVPAVVDLAAMRDAMARLGGDPSKINPQVPVDLVIDHSVQVDVAKQPNALQKNMEFEFQRNKERFAFLKWGAKAFSNMLVVPPGSGIVHQVNLEYLARVVFEDKGVLFPDSLVGTDSHTTMIDGLGVAGWGVGGIEAEAAMLGQELSLADRATIANMSPEYGATMGFFPVDGNTLEYLHMTGRDKSKVELIEAYLRANDLFVDYKQPVDDKVYSSHLDLDLNSVEPCLAGPKRPHDRVPLREMKKDWQACLNNPVGFKGFAIPAASQGKVAKFTYEGQPAELRHGDVVIAAITSCTNTSNPNVMLGAGLVAKKALERGLNVKPHIKTSLAPGSGVVTQYLEKSGLLPDLEKLGFSLVGYGCTTCIGNSGELHEAVSNAITSNDIVASAVLSGNRNFEGRVHPLTRANYLGSPPLVVAYALAGTVDIDFEKEPIGKGKSGKPVYLRDIWPTNEEIAKVVETAVLPEMFKQTYEVITEGNDMWNELDAPEGALYAWDEESTYIHDPPFFKGMTKDPPGVFSVHDAQVLLNLGDSITTDHISPAGNIHKDSAAAKYLMSRGVQRKDFNSYGSRRGNDEVMARGTFANIRIVNKFLKGEVGPSTIHIPSGEKMLTFDAAMKYKEEGRDLVILAGAEYGSGSSRDWAAKGPYLQGVKAVIAKSFERIHRSNLVGMGIIPLCFKPGEDAESLGLTGTELYTIELPKEIKPGMDIEVKVDDGRQFTCVLRFDTQVELTYFEHGGILHFVLRQLLASQ